MAKAKDGVITRTAWNDAKKSCESADTLAECNKTGADVSDDIDGDLTCKWTAYPDRISNNEVEKRDVGGFFEGVGGVFVGKENVLNADCHVSGRGRGIRVK